MRNPTTMGKALLFSPLSGNQDGAGEKTTVGALAALPSVIVEHPVVPPPAAQAQTRIMEAVWLENQGLLTFPQEPVTPPPVRYKAVVVAVIVALLAAGVFVWLMWPVISKTSSQAPSTVSTPSLISLKTVPLVASPKENIWVPAQVPAKEPAPKGYKNPHKKGHRQTAVSTTVAPF